MGKQMPVTLREKYEEIVRDRFRPLINDARILNQEASDILKHKLKNKKGIYKLEGEIAATEVRLKDLKNALRDRAGISDSKIKSEVATLLEREKGIYSVLMAEQKKAIEAIWLAGAPEIVGILLQDIQKALPNLQKQLTAAEKKKLPTSYKRKG